MIRADLCIIGAGAGGLSLAAGAAQMGARVVLVEGAEMGGDCLNHGCVPSKALIEAARAAHTMATAGRFGLAPVRPVVDYAAVMDHVVRTIAAIAPMDSQERFEGLGVQVIRGWGRFASPDTLAAAGQQIRARRFVIATGSCPALPPLPGLDETPYLTNETLFSLRAAPAHLLVLGGGPIGVEMAQAHLRLGVAVTLIESGRLLGREDPELAAQITATLRAEGATVLDQTAALRVEPAGEGVRLHLADGRQILGSHLLVATGRRVALEALNLSAAGVEASATGVRVGDDLRSVSNRRVYAIGDAAGRGQFTHAAGYHAGIVLRQVLLGLPARIGAPIPRVTYSDPELAQVGLTEPEARAAHGDRLQVLHWGFDHNDRAQAMAETTGRIKLMVVRGRAVGVSICGPHAGELIGLWALMLGARLRLSALAGAVLPYPTLSEVSKRAAGAYFSPKLFDNPVIRLVVRSVQRLLP